MKKLYLLLIVLSIFSLQAQNIDWGTSYKLEAPIDNNFSIASGKYIGNIDGFDYYAHFERRMMFFPTNFANVSFTKVEGNEVVNTTPYIENEIILFDIIITNNEIAVLYTKETDEEDIWQVKIDYFNPSDFKLINTTVLNSYKRDGGYFFTFFAKSEDGSKYGIVLDCDNEKEDNKKLIFLVLDQKLNLIWNKDYVTDEKYEISIFKSYINNEGRISLIIFNEEGIVKKGQNKDANGKRIRKDDPVHFPFLQKINVISILNDEVNVVNINKLIDFGSFVELKIKHLKNKDYIAIFSTKTKTFGYKFTLSDQTAEQIFEENTYLGTWKINEIFILQNGQCVTVLSNSNDGPFYYTSGNRTIAFYYYWFMSYRFISFNPETGDVAYNQTLGRNFTWRQNSNSYLNNIYTSTYLSVNENTLSLIYNTNLTKNDDQSDETENPTLEIEKIYSIIDPITKRATIDANGNIETTIINECKGTDPLILPDFIYQKSKNLYQIAKGNKDYITFGTLEF